MNYRPTVLLALIIFSIAVCALADAQPYSHPASRYAAWIKAQWFAGNSFCKSGTPPGLQACSKWFNDVAQDKTTTDLWTAARAKLPDTNPTWPLLRDVRATYGACVESATNPSNPGNVGVAAYQAQLLECDDRLNKAVANLTIQLEDR